MSMSAPHATFTFSITKKYSADNMQIAEVLGGPLLFPKGCSFSYDLFALQSPS